jgi:hypothetical protein
VKRAAVALGLLLWASTASAVECGAWVLWVRWTLYTTQQIVDWREAVAYPAYSACEQGLASTSESQPRAPSRVWWSRGIGPYQGWVSPEDISEGRKVLQLARDNQGSVITKGGMTEFRCLPAGTRP